MIALTLTLLLASRFCDATSVDKALPALSIELALDFGHGVKIGTSIPLPTAVTLSPVQLGSAVATGMYTFNKASSFKKNLDAFEPNDLDKAYIHYLSNCGKIKARAAIFKHLSRSEQEELTQFSKEFAAVLDGTIAGIRAVNALKQEDLEQIRADYYASVAGATAFSASTLMPPVIIIGTFITASVGGYAMKFSVEQSMLEGMMLQDLEVASQEVHAALKSMR
eukprot:TRINITY_DN3196_c0_g2_i2.p1 TRINITY_DN3196_c0_g2~~TRINITY_DN3196_c0_g2_i2.p1  ORF type:complete len:223 (+),score=43.74 TRINITY_DN3196_c0_g2_i2:3-671(+)